jgi:hypothetical protein
MIYTVFKILEHDRKSLLLIQDKTTDEFSISVYDEGNNNTLMRMSKPSVEEFKRAIEVIESK